MAVFQLVACPLSDPVIISQITTPLLKTWQGLPIQLRVKAFQRSQALRGLPSPSSLWTPPTALSLPRPASPLPKAYVLAVPSAWSAPS